MVNNGVTFGLGLNFNFGVESVFTQSSKEVTSITPIAGNFELLDGTPFLLLDGSNFTLL
jgi:hypothetical protein